MRVFRINLALTTGLGIVLCALAQIFQIPLLGLYVQSTDPAYDAVIAEGIHPWVGAGAVTEEQILRGAEYGGELFTSNHPTYVSEVLRKNGYR